MSTPRRREPLKAILALRALMRNKEDTSQVFKIMQALAGDSMQKQFLKFKDTATAQKVLNADHELLDVLKDRERLATLPEGSLGRAYLQFVVSENISAEGLSEADQTRDERDQNIDPDQSLYGRRLREMHDLWHVVTGYGRDALGEASVVAFSYPQTTSLGFAAIAIIGALKITSEFPGQGVIGTVWQAYRAGKRAAWLPGQDWEVLLTQPLDQVRRDLNIGEPTKYLAASYVIENTGAPEPAMA